MSDPQHTILLISGANLNLFGARQPEVYGSVTLDDMVDLARTTAQAAGWSLEHVQSNHEGDLVDAIQAARASAAAIVINAGAFTHYAWSLHDALAAYEGVVVELHVSNIAAREPWRHTSVIAPVATGQVVGMGVLGYELAVRAAIGLVAARSGR